MEEWKLTTPVVFMVFKRLDTTKQVFEKIREAKPEKLYIISDGPRANVDGEYEKVKSVRDYIEQNIDWDCDVKKDYSETNMGSRYRIVTGLDRVFQQEEMALILEDDIVPHPTFFRFCQDMLYHYREDTRIGMITGCNLCADYATNKPYYFSRMVENWGWATWRRAWKTYDSDVKNWEEIKKEGYLEKYFGNRAYAKEIATGLDMVKYHGLDAWDCQWVYNMAVQSQYSIMPAVNLVHNIGFNSNDATHTKEKSRFKFPDGEIEFPIAYLTDVKHEVEYDQKFIKKNYDLNPFKKLFLMVESYITIHLKNK